ncbi:MAG: DUF3185 family protein [Verrucomicrobia bacterium]|nr:DUF3185 family protein [Verrucomicrobiota bacterium]
MNKSIGLALLALGIALIAFGVSASQSFGSEAKRFFTGSSTDKSMWLVLGAIAATTVGGMTCMRKADPRSSTTKASSTLLRTNIKGFFFCLFPVAFLMCVSIGCKHTANGVGKDIKNMGEKIEEKTQ